MGRKATWQKQLDVSRAEAILAVKLFNDPTEVRPFESFIVHMQMAYLYLMISDATNKGIEVRVPDNKTQGKFLKADGEYKTKSLGDLVRVLHPNAEPLRMNIEFFIGLRNKIEHRAPLSRDASELFPEVIAGEIQAYLVNYERLLTEVGGPEYSLARKLRFPLFVGGFTEEAKAHLASLTRALPGDLRRFMANYKRGLAEEVTSDPRYSMALDVTLSKKQRNAHLNLNFISDEANLFGGPKPTDGYLIAQYRTIQVDGVGLFKPGEATKKIAGLIPFVFNAAHFTSSWQRNGVRPLTGAENPSFTQVEFCTYSQTFRQYTYTQAYIDRVVSECQTDTGFRECTGREAKPI